MNGFRSETISKIEQDYQKALLYMGSSSEDIKNQIQMLEETEAICMKYLYAYMPLSDVGAYDFTVFLGYAKHAVFLLNNAPYMDKIPEEYFFNYILSHRINSEDITDCRAFFYEKVADRIRSLSMEEAVLEINNWCYEQATYRSTSERTASPYTVYLGGFGRCGEESTLLTTVLRSVGIPARQIYVPRWSHSDSNHAWVEIWCDGTWYFTGACEPKPILNNGWFTYAASRAMLVHSRLFTGFGYDQEQVANKDGTVTVLNHIDRYAKGNNFTIRVVDEQKNPMPEALVRVEIVNSAEFFPIAILRTGEDGTANIKLGLGEVHLQGLYKGASGSAFVNVKDSNEVTIITTKENPSQGWNKYRITAPDSIVLTGIDMTKEQEQLQDEKNKGGDLLRQNRQDSYYDEAYVKQWKEYPSILHTLNNAKGNFSEIRKFLDAEVSSVGVSEKDSLLKVISLKDCRDIKAETLLDQLDALRYQYLYEKEIFEQYVLSPIISIEKATPFRSFIRNYFGEEGEELVKKPEQLLSFLDNEIVYYPEKEYDTIVSTPKSTLMTKAGSPLSKKVLFVAICRTYGLAARLDNVYSEPQYYKENGFVFADEKLREHSRLTLLSEDVKAPVYYQQFTIGYKKEDGSYQTLDLWGNDFVDGKLVVELIPGNYRIVTCDRMNSGSILGKINHFTLSPEQEQEFSIVCSELKAEDLITETPLSSFGLLDGEGKYTSCDVICGEDKNIFIFADPGKEPTEHVFNEMLQLAKMGEFPPCKIHLILKEGALLKDETLCKFLKVYGETVLWKDELDHTLTAFGLATGVDATKLPFIAVTKGSDRCIYSCSGYRVGSADVLARLIRE